MNLYTKLACIFCVLPVVSKAEPLYGDFLTYTKPVVGKLNNATLETNIKPYDEINDKTEIVYNPLHDELLAYDPKADYESTENPSLNLSDNELLIYNFKPYTPKPFTGASNPDPFEKVNRKIFAFNYAIDNKVLKPLSRGYSKVVPKPVKTGISNFFSNIDDVLVITNDLLQFKFKQALTDTSRFLFNSTLGLGGLIDISTMMGFEKNNEDFGQTLATWGVKPGPYLMLPFVGPSSGRHLFGKAAEFYLNNQSFLSFNGKKIYLHNLLNNLPAESKTALQITNLLNYRADMISKDTMFESIAVDKYATLRDSFLQSREYLATDGKILQPDGTMSTMEVPISTVDAGVEAMLSLDDDLL